jgi:hypothetical protein
MLHRLVTRSQPWLVSPIMDVFLCCGGLMWLLLLLRSQLHVDNQELADSLFSSFAILTTHALSDTHTAATLVKVAKNTDRYPFKSWPVALPLAIAVFTLIGALFFDNILSIFLRLYLVLIIHHYCRQSYGVMLIYCSRASSYCISYGTKSALSVFLDCVAFAGIIRTFGDGAFVPTNVLGHSLPVLQTTSPILLALSGISLFASSIVLGIFLVREQRLRGVGLPLPAWLVLLSTIALLLSDQKINSGLWLLAPAFFHGSQYLLIVIATAKSHANGINESLSEYACLLLFISILIYFALPRILQAIGFSAVIAGASVLCSASFHHFLTDALIWRRPKMDFRISPTLSQG